MQFNIGDTFRTFSIVLNDDSVCENETNEHFFSFIQLGSGMQPIYIVQPNTTITIDDSEEAECRKIITINDLSLWSINLN